MEYENCPFKAKYESCVDPTLQLSEKFLESKNVTWSALNKEMITVRINDFHFAPKVRRLQPIRSERHIAVLHGLHAHNNAGRFYRGQPGITIRLRYTESVREN